MSISRRLPNSDETITTVIRKAFARMGIVLPVDIPFTLATQTFLTAFIALWNAAIMSKNEALSEQTAATALADGERDDLRTYINHFIQVFNLGITRKIYTAAQRSFFDLPIDSDALPSLITDDDLVLWAGRIADGNARRVTAGGAAMSNPTAAEVATIYTRFGLAINAQALKVLAFQNASTVVVNLRADGNKLCLKIYDEAEAFFNELPPATKRERCRPWGVRYVSTVMMTINMLIIDSVTLKPIAQASTYLVEGDTTHVGNAEGINSIETTAADEATLITNADGYVQDTTVVTFETGAVVYAITVKMTAV